MDKQKKLSLNLLLQIVLSIGMIIVAYAVTFRSSIALGLGTGPQNIEAIKTTLAGTAQALLNPFPTATVPTRTASPTATATPRISATPTFTPSKTFTPVPTRTLLGTATVPEHSRRLTQTAVVLTTKTLRPPGTVVARTPTAVRTATSPVTVTQGPTRGPTFTPIPPTSTPRPTSTRTRRPTRIPPTNTPPPPPTNTPPPPPSDTPEPPPTVYP